VNTLGIAIATYERAALTVASFAKVHDDPRVSDVVISDDGSDALTFDALMALTRPLGKVRLAWHPYNEGSWANKRRAVEMSRAEWVIVLDSDNSIASHFLDALFVQQWDEDVLYVPVRGTPALNYERYSELVIDRQNVTRWLDQPGFQMALNTGNFFVHRQNYLLVSEGAAEESFASDGIYFVYRWLASGRSVFVTPDLSYAHLVHEGHWTRTAGPSLAFAAELIRRMRADIWEVPCVA
jgi:glycosyltransferase involved in cell wall biosynthesis